MSMYPLANDEDGMPVEVPTQAVGWLVRRHGGGRGRPGTVYDREGRPLIVPLDATADELRAAGCGPGSYRLDALGDDRRLLNATAYTEVPRDLDDHEARVASSSSSRDAEISALARVCEAMQRTQAEQIRATVERERQLAERERQLLETIQKLTQAPTPPTQLDRLRNARAEDLELREFLRETLDQEREQARRAEKAARRQPRDGERDEKEDGANAIKAAVIRGVATLAGPVIGMAAEHWGLGITPERIQAWTAVGQQAGNVMSNLFTDEGPGSDAADRDAAPEDDGNGDDAGEEEDQDESGEAEAERLADAIGEKANVSDPSLRDKLRTTLALMTTAERSAAASYLGRLSKGQLDFLLGQLRGLAPEVAVAMFRQQAASRAAKEV